MKTLFVRMMTLVLLASAFLVASCQRPSDENAADMAEVVEHGDLIYVTERGDGSYTVLYCKMDGKTFGIVGEEPMADGERFKFSEDAYTYVGDHGVTFSGKPFPVVMPVYAKKGSIHYYMYLGLLEI